MASFEELLAPAGELLLKRIFRHSLISICKKKAMQDFLESLMYSRISQIREQLIARRQFDSFEDDDSIGNQND